MKELKKTIILPLSFDKAWQLVFNDSRVNELLNAKNKFTATQWSDDKREISYYISSDNMSPTLVKILGKENLKVHILQYIKLKDSESIVVGNKVSPQFLGSNMVKIKPLFKLQKKTENQTEFMIHFRFYAYIPPPFNTLVEDFMKLSSEKDNEFFIMILNHFT